MAKLNAKARKAIPSGQFALPAQRKYPIEDAAHARNALARAEQQYNAGNLSKSQHDQIVARAHAKLASGHGHKKGV